LGSLAASESAPSFLPVYCATVAVVVCLDASWPGTDHHLRSHLTPRSKQAATKAIHHGHSFHHSHSFILNTVSCTIAPSLTAADPARRIFVDSFLAYERTKSTKIGAIRKQKAAWVWVCYVHSDVIAPFLSDYVRARTYVQYERSRIE
jgi:hypothetical protein